MARDETSSSIGHVMPGKRAGEVLGRIKSAAMAVVDAPQRARRNNAGARGGIRSPRQVLTRLAADCTWQNVLGTPEGVLPARPGPRPTKGEEDQSDAERAAQEQAEWAERQARRAAERAERQAAAAAAAAAAATAVAAAAVVADREAGVTREQEARASAAAAAKRKGSAEGERDEHLGTGEREQKQDKGHGAGVDGASLKKLEEAAATELHVTRTTTRMASIAEVLRETAEVENISRVLVYGSNSAEYPRDLLEKARRMPTFAELLEPLGLVDEYEPEFQRCGILFENLCNVTREDLVEVVGITNRVDQINKMGQIKRCFSDPPPQRHFFDDGPDDGDSGDEFPDVPLFNGAIATSCGGTEMNNRVVKACLAAGCSVVGPVLAFSASGFGVKALDSAEGVSSSTRRSTTPWMGQSFNAQAVSSMTRVVRHPALALPHLSLAHIGHLDFEGLKAMGCKGIVFDKDNTLTAPYEDTVHPLVEEGLRRCVEVFEGRVCIMSNSAGTRDDPDYADAIRIEKAMGIPVIRHDEKKPGGIAQVLAFFEGKEPEGGPVRLDELCFVGDRLLTDVVFGNLHGMLTVHTQPLTLKGDNRPAAVFRFLERKVFMGFFRQTCSVEPQAHRLCPEGAGILDRGGGKAAQKRETTPVLNEAS
eukprot:g20307.t3